MVNSSQFSKRLQKILDFYGISATAFSEIISFNRSTISHLLSGRNKPSLEFVMKVLEAYPEVELYWLLNGKGSFPSTSKIDSIPISEVDIKQTQTISERPSLKEIEISEAPQKKLQPLKIDSGNSKNDAFDSLKEKAPNSATIDRIIIFYKDGTFSEYKNA